MFVIPKTGRRGRRVMEQLLPVRGSNLFLHAMEIWDLIDSSRLGTSLPGPAFDLFPQATKSLGVPTGASMLSANLGTKKAAPAREPPS